MSHSALEAAAARTPGGRSPGSRGPLRRRCWMTGGRALDDRASPRDDRRDDHPDHALMTLLAILFWLSCALIVWTQLGYRLALVLAARRAGRCGRAGAAATAERGAARAVADRRRPRRAGGDRGQGRERARARLPARAAGADRRLRRLQRRRPPSAPARAGADLVLELPRGGKIRAQDAAVERARGEILAFSDANALWDAGAAARAGRAHSPIRQVGYACGQVRFDGRRDAGRPTRRALYWRYELALREPESRLSSITAGNGAIYATRRDSYIVVDPIMGHDLSLPFNMVKRGPARGLRPRRPRQREDGPLARGRVRAQAPHDEPHLADPPARRDALAARLSARLRADDHLPPRCCATAPRACTWSRSRQRRARRARRGRRSTSSRSVLQLALLAAAALGGAAAAAAAAHRPLLRAHHRLAAPPGCGTGCATARAPRGRSAEGTR